MRFFGPLLAGALALCVITPASAQIYILPSQPVVIVQDSSKPKKFDPYYNKSKVRYAPAPVYYETKEKTKKGNKVTTKTTVKNQYGQVVYQNKSVKKQKKKK